MLGLLGMYLLTLPKCPSTYAIWREKSCFYVAHQTYCAFGSKLLATYFFRQITIINSKFCYFSLNLSSHPFFFLQKMGSTGENRAPKFVRKPQLRQEDDGNRLIFECELSGHPQPEVTWFRQGQAHHMLSRFLNLQIYEFFFTKFSLTYSIQSRSFLLRSKMPI